LAHHRVTSTTVNEYVGGGFERPNIEYLLEMLNNHHNGCSAMMAPIIIGNPDRPELAAELERSSGAGRLRAHFQYSI
jgi:hypothetical protein